MHSSLSDLHKNIDKKVLPKEYGGEMPMAEMIGNYKKTFSTTYVNVLSCYFFQLYGKKNYWHVEKQC